MNAQQSLTKTGIWEIKDGDDMVICWLSGDGFSCKRISLSSESKQIEHSIQKVKWTDLIDKAEDQLKLPI